LSAKLLGEVWELELAGHLQPVLLALADHAKPDGSDCYPSVGRVAWMLGKDRRTVQRAFRELEELGLLRLIEPGGGKGNPGLYTIDLSRAPRKPPFVPLRGEPAKGGTDAADGVDSKGGTGAAVRDSQRAASDAAKGGTGVPQRAAPVPHEPTTNQLQPTDNGCTTPSSNGRPDFELELDGAQVVRWDGGLILDAWLQRNPVLSTRLSARERGRLGAACKRLAEEHTREEVAAAFVGMGLIFPHASPPAGKGEPWDPMDLEQKFPKALAAAADHPKVKQQRAAKSLREDLEARRNGHGRR
jgi:hypothetical protein